MSIKGFKVNGTIQKYDYNALENIPTLNTETDKTLAIDDVPADAKATGDRISNLQSLVVEYEAIVHPDPHQLWDKSISSSLTNNNLIINAARLTISIDYRARIYVIEVNGASGDQFSFNLLNSKTFADFGISSAEIYASNVYPQVGGTVLQRGTASTTYYRGLINLAQASKYIIINLFGSGFTDADNAKENCDAFMDNVVVRKGGYDTTYYEYSATIEYNTDYKVLPIDQGIGNAGKMLIVGDDGKITVGTLISPETSDNIKYHPLQSVSVGNNLFSSNTSVALGDNWSGDLINGLTHTVGANSNVVITIPMTENKRYMFAFTLTSEFEGGLTVAFGNSSPIDVYGLTLDKKIGFVSDGIGTITISAKSSLNTTLSLFALLEIVENGTELVFGAKNVNHGNTVSSISGFWNVAIGSDTTQCDNINGSRNIAIGYEAQHMLKQGTRNVGVGTFAMPFVKEGDRNIAIGSDSLYSGSNVNSENKAYDNVAIGYASLHDGPLIQRNVAVGIRAMKDGSGDATENVVVGFQAGNYSHKYNTFVGNRAGYYNQSDLNVAVGCEAGSDMYVNGQKNIAIGAKSGIDNTGGTSSSPRNIDNTIAIGFGVKAKESNQACFGSSDQTIILAGKKIVFNQDGTVTWETLT